jgi:hypothetical protein
MTRSVASSCLAPIVASPSRFPRVDQAGSEATARRNAWRREPRRFARLEPSLMLQDTATCRPLWRLVGRRVRTGPARRLPGRVDARDALAELAWFEERLAPALQRMCGIIAGGSSSTKGSWRSASRLTVPSDEGPVPVRREAHRRSQRDREPWRYSAARRRPSFRAASPTISASLAPVPRPLLSRCVATFPTSTYSTALMSPQVTVSVAPLWSGAQPIATCGVTFGTCAFSPRGALHFASVGPSTFHGGPPLNGSRAKPPTSG